MDSSLVLQVESKDMSGHLFVWTIESIQPLSLSIVDERGDRVSFEAS